MPSEPLTLMAVHAHPDDEATGTGGILAAYADRGVRTVLVTCTDGSCGDGPGGTKPGDAGHDPAEVARIRTAELEKACAILGVGALEQLGYRDSGMMGWATNDAPGAFWGMDVEAAAAPLVALMERYRPQVVVTYDANGFYGHPDHIMAHRIAMVAMAASGIPQKLYYVAMPRSGMATFRRTLEDAGLELPELDGADGDGPAPPDDVTATAGAAPQFGTPDSLVTSSIDVEAWAGTKKASLAAHSSQAENIFFLRFGDEVFARLFGREHFVRAVDRTGGDVPEDDLFAGLRSLS